MHTLSNVVTRIHEIAEPHPDVRVLSLIDANLEAIAFELTPRALHKQSAVDALALLLQARALIVEALDTRKDSEREADLRKALTDLRDACRPDQPDEPPTAARPSTATSTVADGAQHGTIEAIEETEAIEENVNMRRRTEVARSTAATK